MKKVFLLTPLLFILSCHNDETTNYIETPTYNLYNYSNQEIPNYILKDNSSANPITDEGATLGRVLFYDTNLSFDNSTACASCHQQAFAFSDPNQVSTGINGITPRHSMRLVNIRFSYETRMFWDERASSLEDQTTMPIKDHIEMGFSGTNGDPSIETLLTRLSQIDYYQELFTLAFGDATITEVRLQLALSQFVRSIQSFDSKFDVGRAMVNNDLEPFPNYTLEENAGKFLFITPPQFDNSGNRIGGGVGCQGCHRAPEFDIDPNSLNNGIAFNAQDMFDINVERAPSLRDVVNQNAEVNGSFMHSGNLTSLNAVLDHYNIIVPNTNTDPRLTPGGNPQRLQLTIQERQQLIAFMETLTGLNVYTDEKWSNPFNNLGNVHWEQD